MEEKLDLGLSEIIKNKLIFLYKEFIYGGHLQSLGASSIVYITSVFLNIKVEWSSLVAAYLIFYSLYLFNRWKEIEIDCITNPERTSHLKKYIHIMPAIFWSTIVIIISFLAYFGNLKSFIFGIMLVVFGLFYTTIFKNVTRKIFLFKNFYVASFFMFLVLFTAVYYSLPLTDLSVIIPIIMLMVFVFGKAFIMQVLLDLKDIESDREEGLKTLGVTIGMKKTIKILKIMSVVFTAPIIIFIFLPLFPIVILMFLFTIFLNFYSFDLAKNKNYLGYIIGSGEFIFWSILILIGKSLG